MWIMRRPSLKDSPPSENIEPQHLNTAPTANSLSTPFSTQIESIAKNIAQYCPLSDLLCMKTLLSSTHTQLRKFRESVFLGQIKQNKRNGLGLMVYINGRVYEGYWNDNYKQGKGFEKFSNNSVYKGDYVRGKPEGCGRYEWENGELYEGQWANGLKHGSGIWRGAKGDSYIGEWREGRADGYGVHTWVNGDRYEGEFKDCLKHGQGVEHFANGDSYKGNYENGKPSGYGEYYWSGGSFFKGQFKAGLRCGQGVWKKGAGRTDKYEGEWNADKKEGYGVFTWADGNVYKGHFVGDLKQGAGQMHYLDGSVVNGRWQRDQMVQEQPVVEFDHDQDCELLVPNADNIQQYQIKVTYGNNKNSSNSKARLQMYPEQYDPKSFCVEELSMYPQYIQPRHQQYIEYQHPQYMQPQRPFFKSQSKHFRPRNITRTNVRSEVKPREESQGGRRPTLNKKMSAGVVRGKSDLGKKTEKSMSSSFFMYKISGDDKNRQQLLRDNVKNRDGGFVRQVRTSGGSRGQRHSQWQEELKYFARSKMSSYSELR